MTSFRDHITLLDKRDFADVFDVADPWALRWGEFQDVPNLIIGDLENR